MTFTGDIGLTISQVVDDGVMRYMHGLGRFAQVESALLLGGRSRVGNGADVENSYEYDVFGGISGAPAYLNAKAGLEVMAG